MPDRKTVLCLIVSFNKTINNYNSIWNFKARYFKYLILLQSSHVSSRTEVAAVAGINLVGVPQPKPMHGFSLNLR